MARLEHLVELADRVETKRRLEAVRGEGSDGVNFRGVPKMSNEKKAGLKRLFRVFVGNEILANLYGDYFIGPNIRIPSFNIQGSMERIRPWLIPKAPRFRSRVLREFSTTPGQDEWWGAVA